MKFAFPLSYNRSFGLIFGHVGVYFSGSRSSIASTIEVPLLSLFQKLNMGQKFVESIGLLYVHKKITFQSGCNDELI